MIPLDADWSIFRGSRVRLRAVEPDDWEIHYHWDQSSEGGRATDYVWFPISTARAQKWAEGQAQQADGDNFRFQIETLDAEYVGTINTHHCDLRTGTFSYGLAIVPEQRRKGYGTEAIRLVLRYYFHERRYQKCTVTVYDFNIPSKVLHERLGFVLEGRLRRMGFTAGQHFDHLIYGMTREGFSVEHGDSLP